MKSCAFSKFIERRAVILWVGLLVSAGVAYGDIIPSNRRITWDPGVPGGVPNRTTIYTTLPAGSSLSSIQTALNNCPSNQVVQLSAGTYTINGSLSIPSYKTLRGAGPGQTVLNLTGGADGAVYLGYPSKNSWPQSPANTAITGGATAGSTSITVASASGISKGTYLVINQLNDTSFVNSGGEQGCGYCDDGWGPSDRLMGQIVEVTSVSGNTVSFDPPLYWSYNSSLSPLAFPYSMYTKYAGLESVKLSANDSGYMANVVMDMAAYCWLKNIESDFADGDHVWITWAFRCEVRDSFFHDGYNHGPGTTDDTLKLNWKTTACLVENNIFWRMHTSVMFNYGCAGNVVAYNYSTNNYHDNSLSWELQDFDFHNAHPTFNLTEGNIGVQYHPDTLHGSSSHNTAFRNWFAGANYYAPPQDARGTVQWGSGYYETANAVAFCLDYLTRSNNLVGNIAGSPWQVSNGGSYLSVAPSGMANPVCFAFGYDGSHNSYDNKSYVSTLMHGNYDYVNKAQNWDSTISDHTLPNSLYLTSKPAFFGNMAWPPIDPSNPSTANRLGLPAGYRFVYGTNPPSGPINQSPVVVATASTKSGPAPLLVNFSSTGSSDPEGTALSYSWNFGDGTTSTQASPSHTYSSSGTFTAYLSVSDGTNTTTSTNISITVTVAGANSPPVAMAGATPSSGVAPLAVSFSSVGSYDPEGTTLTYSWTFGDGNTSTAANPAHTYSTSGVYSAKLTVSDGTNSTSSSVIPVTVGNGSTGLVAAYGFEEGSGTTVGDVSGNGNSGVISGATWATGKYGKALSFDGVSSAVTVNDSAPLELTSGMTLEAWVYPTALSGVTDIIYKDSVDYYLVGSLAAGSGPALGGNFAATDLYGPASALPLNTWSHIAATYDGTTMQLFVNGVLVASQAQTGSMTTSSGSLMIGGNPNASGKSFAGMIDEVRIYNRALSTTQILSDMNTPTVGTVTTPSPPQGLRIVVN